MAPYLALGDGHGRWRSRVRGLPEVFGDLPADTLADEIETPGDGQVRALFVYAGNPVLSVPNSRRLSRALEKLEFMVAIDVYVNETTRHADVILPPAWTFAEDYFEAFLPNVAVRNVARFAPPVIARGAGERADWEILLEIAERHGRRGERVLRGGPHHPIGSPPRPALDAEHHDRHAAAAWSARRPLPAVVARASI